MTDVSNLQLKMQALQQQQNNILSKPNDILSIAEDQQIPQKLKDEKPSSKKDSIINTLKQTMKSLSNQKPKHNPLLIDQDIQEQQKISSSLPLRESLKESIINVSRIIQETALDITGQDESKIQQVFEEIKPQITVDITQTAQKGGSISKATSYTIKGEDMHGRFLVKRKYNEFLSLRKIIAQRWPGSYIPGLKNKFDMKNEDQKSLLMIKVLANFLIGLSYSKHIYYKEEVQLFLRYPDIDICEMFQQMPDLRVSDLISRFQYAFEQQLQEIQGPKITQTLAKFHKKLRKIIQILQDVTNKSLALAESYDNYVKHLSKFGQIMRFYQHFSLAQFTQNSRDMTLLVKDDDKKIDKMKQIFLINPFYELFTLFQIELIDVKAFLDTVIAIGLYELRKDQLQKEIIQNEGKKQAMQSGSLTIKSMATRKGKQELSKQTEGKLKKLIQEKQQVVKMYQIAQKITAKKIIPTFKAIKKNIYCLALKKWISLVNKEIPQLQSVWNFVATEAEDAKSNDGPLLKFQC